MVVVCKVREMEREAENMTQSRLKMRVHWLPKTNLRGLWDKV